MESTKAHIIPLAPVNELCKDGNIKKRSNDFSVYKKYLNAAFEKESINNIAITGNFGVGKSSILQSYDADLHEGRRKFLYVSLSDLTGQDIDAAEKQKLEYSLLCQILAGCEESLLPNSTFQLIPQRKHKREGLFSIGAAMLFSLVYIGAMRDDIFRALEEGAARSEILAWITSNAMFIRLGFHTVLGLLLAYAVYNISKYLLCHRSLKDMKFAGGPIEIETKLSHSCSYLDQYIFELIYALECIAPKIDYTVIFEDFDRLDKKACIEIFTKLREINKLINVRLSPEKHIRFIYVFSDGIFDYTRQTKFFDYCLPVIPILSAKNAAEELRLVYFDDIQVKNTHDIAEAAAPYLTDFRTVHNIINDYRIFEEIEGHRNGELSNERKKDLLAFMIYKNLEPQDYDNIRKNSSVVFHACEGELVNETLITALMEKNYLSGDCLLFIGYSKEQMKLHCTDILKNRSYEEKKNNLDNDRKGLYLEIISNTAQDFIKTPHKDNFSALFHGIEFAFLDYLLNYLVSSENLEEWSRDALSNINIILYDRGLFQYVCSDRESADICDKSLRNLFWKFDEETIYQILRYLFIIGYWSKGSSFDWFFSAEADTLPNASDENKVRCFLRFRKMLVQEQLSVPKAIDTAARNWLALLPHNGITTHWADRSLIKMIDLFFAGCVPLELQRIEVTIDNATLPLINHLCLYAEDHYWDYSTDRRQKILLTTFSQCGRLPDCFFLQEQQESEYSTDENKVLDFLWLWDRADNIGNAYIPSLQLEDSAKQWLSSLPLKSSSLWDAENLSLLRMIDLLYPTPDTVPDPLKMVWIRGENEEMCVKDLLDRYYKQNYWRYDTQKRFMILYDLIKKGYWNRSPNDFSWFFAGEDVLDQNRLQDLLELIGTYSIHLSVDFIDRIRKWVSSLLKQDIYRKNPDIEKLTDYIYQFDTPTVDLLDHYYIHNYWEYNTKKRITILLNLTKKDYWSSSPNDSSCFFSGEDVSDQDWLQDLLELIGAYNRPLPISFKYCIQNWVNNLLEQDIHWQNLDIIQLIDYIYDYRVPSDVGKRKLTVRDNKEKSIDTYLQDFKFVYYWNYHQDSRFTFLKRIFYSGYWQRGANVDWFFSPKENAKFNSDQNRAGDFLKLCQWIEEENQDYRKAAGFLEGGYMWIQTITDGGVATEWEDDSLVHMILTIQDRLPTEIPPGLRKVTLRIAGKTEMLDVLLRETR